MTKPFTFIAAVVFIVVAAAHAYRLFAGLDITIGGYVIPMWVSWPGLVIPGLLAFMLFVESRS